jgi:hypothetical protein
LAAFAYPTRLHRGKTSFAKSSRAGLEDVPGQQPGVCC